MSIVSIAYREVYDLSVDRHGLKVTKQEQFKEQFQVVSILNNITLLL